MVKELIENIIKMAFKRTTPGVEVEVKIFQKKEETLRFDTLLSRFEANPALKARTRFWWDGYDICRIIPTRGGYTPVAWLGEERGEKALDCVLTGWHMVRTETVLDEPLTLYGGAVALGEVA